MAIRALRDVLSRGRWGWVGLCGFGGLSQPSRLTNGNDGGDEWGLIGLFLASLNDFMLQYGPGLRARPGQQGDLQLCIAVVLTSNKPATNKAKAFTDWPLRLHFWSSTFLHFWKGVLFWMSSSSNWKKRRYQEQSPWVHLSVL